MLTIEKVLEENKNAYIAGEYDAAVVGAGHAGCEAAHALAKMKNKTILFTLHLDALANLPCNPSIGGTAKGQLVREIDALGGVMGKVADECAIQMRMLNRSKGPAVFSPRAQMDRTKYSYTMKHLLENTDNLVIKQAHIVKLLTEEREAGKIRVTGVLSSTGAIYKCNAVVICSGTYMESRTILGEVITESGPDGLPRSVGLSASLSELGIPMLRFKTGTPVRVNKKSVDFSEMTRQDGEDDIPPFSFEREMDGKTVAPTEEQVPCWSIWTTEQTKEIITSNLDRSPLYSGIIDGIGPRYCPSIEDKFVRFSDKPRHQIFVEPMGNSTNEMYLQGFSTSLPEDVQAQMVKSLPGLKDAVIQRNAYAIEYDLVDPLSLKLSLESKIAEGLFTAGQINGSSGYEEAAGQGIIAGINAGRFLRKEPPVILDRSKAYIGVLIDDLVTKGTNEPYRMMTSRAEYRLFLRQDNADLRLTPVGHEIGLIDDDRFAAFEEKYRIVESEKERLASTYTAPTKELEELLASVDSTVPKSGASLAELIKRPRVTYALLAPVDKNRPQCSEAEIRAIETDIKYEGYIKLELENIERFKELESKIIPEAIDYENIHGLRKEAVQKLSKLRPVNVGQANRISGVSPADVNVLIVYLEAHKRDFAN